MNDFTFYSLFNMIYHKIRMRGVTGYLDVPMPSATELKQLLDEVRTRLRIPQQAGPDWTKVKDMTSTQGWRSAG